MDVCGHLFNQKFFPFGFLKWMLLFLFRKDRSSAVALQDSSKLGNLTKEINEVNTKFFTGIE